ncbi:nucleotidyltransferase domain-containing protein [Streptosporangium sp. NPDC049644]|uniref:nucleotidyltransferase domain-containing protein n=1 Tax=Streptosporangium sp. NPDC049644 TaxID=3155507 RepID=UPI00343E1F52
MDSHRKIAERDDVLAVLLAGSVCRGEHVATSDIDLLVVTTEDSALEAGPRRLVQGLLAEWVARPEAEWLTRFDRPKTSWLYSFLEAEVLLRSDPAPDGATANRARPSRPRTRLMVRTVVSAGRL